METILVQINNEKAYKLLRDLEELDIIKLLKKDRQSPAKISNKYRGVFSETNAKDFNEYIQTARKGWNNI